MRRLVGVKKNLRVLGPIKPDTTFFQIWFCSRDRTLLSLDLSLAPEPAAADQREAPPASKRFSEAPFLHIG